MNCWHVSLTFSVGEQLLFTDMDGQTRHANLPSQLDNLPRAPFLMTPWEMLQPAVEPYTQTYMFMYCTWPLFTLGSVYSTSASRAEQTIYWERYFKLNITLLRIPTGRSVAILNLVVSKSPGPSQTQINFSYFSWQLLHVSGLYPLFPFRVQHSGIQL